jgi:FKBP-type peptidyl-prolyl cis-trans isomerase FkpA
MRTNMKKLFPGILIFFLVSSFFTSCLQDTVQYTAEKEQEDLNNYLANLKTQGYNVDTTALGVYYVRLTEGTGDFPVAGDTISVRYVGYLMDRSVFDTSFYNSSDSSWTYVYKVQKVIASWDEITGLMNKGCKMEFIIPSSLAYGSTGAGVVPPYSSLIFVAIMYDVRKK